MLTGLVRRRAELTCEKEQVHDRLRALVADLKHLDATVLQFDPQYTVEEIRPTALRPPANRAQRGQMSRIVLGILCQAAEPMTTPDIALELRTARGHEHTDRLLRLMTKRAGVALRIQWDNGVVRSEQGPGQFASWVVDR